MENRKESDAPSVAEVTTPFSGNSDKISESPSFPSLSLDSVSEKPDKSKILQRSSVLLTPSKETLALGSAARSRYPESSPGFCHRDEIKYQKKRGGGGVGGEGRLSFLSSSPPPPPSHSSSSEGDFHPMRVISPSPSASVEKSFPTTSPEKAGSDVALLLSSYSMYAFLRLEKRLKEAVTLTRTMCINMEDPPSPPGSPSEQNRGKALEGSEGEMSSTSGFRRSPYLNRLLGSSSEGKGVDPPPLPPSSASASPVRRGNPEGGTLGMPPLSPSKCFTRKSFSATSATGKSEENIPERIQALRSKQKMFVSD